MTSLAYNDDKEKEQLSCPDNNHPHVIDLGLPSGTKWACCNVGATKPEGNGKYFAWGETEQKKMYSWKTYIHCDGTKKSCHDIGSNICGTEYDVARITWGDSWRMPSYEQIRELLDKCSYQWTGINGIKGAKFTGPNGECIFLPAVGYRADSEIFNRGDNGFYWSGTQCPNENRSAYFFTISSYKPYLVSNFRDGGYSVRPVSP